MPFVPDSFCIPAFAWLTWCCRACHRLAWDVGFCSGSLCCGCEGPLALASSVVQLMVFAHAFMIHLVRVIFKTGTSQPSWAYFTDWQNRELGSVTVPLSTVLLLHPAAQAAEEQKEEEEKEGKEEGAGAAAGPAARKAGSDGGTAKAQPAQVGIICVTRFGSHSLFTSCCADAASVVCGLQCTGPQACGDLASGAICACSTPHSIARASFHSALGKGSAPGVKT